MRHIIFGGFEHLRLTSEIELLGIKAMAQHLSYIHEAAHAMRNCDLARAKGKLMSYLLYDPTNLAVQEVVNSIPR